MKYSIYAALHDDIDTGWVWIWPRPYHQRCVVKIVNRKNRRLIFCEALEIDSNFCSRYNQPPRLQIQISTPSIVISDWYRKRLDIKKNEEVDLDTALSNGTSAKLKSCLQHPQNVVRISTRLAIISVLLGLLGVILGVLSLRGSSTEQRDTPNTNSPSAHGVGGR